MFIVTKENEDGSFDSVGMNNRRLVDLKTAGGVLRRLYRHGFIKPGNRIRVEAFRRTYDEYPYHTLTTRLP